MDSPAITTIYRGKPLLLEGTNFSGRSTLLHYWTDECRRQGDRGIYVGPDVHQSVSSLVPTVRDELLLHLASAPNEEHFFQVARSLNLERCFAQSPFTLSGGEQVLLVTLCKLGLRASLLAFDGTMDELDSENALRVSELLSSEVAANTATILTANGYEEDRTWQPPLRRQVSDFPRQTKPSERPRFSASDFLFTPPSASGCLEVDRLSFAYVADSPVLRDVGFSLEPGHVYALEGRNGAGKTTLARILTGVLKVRRGRIAFGGRTWDAWKAPGHVAVMQMQNPDTQLFADSVERELADLPEPSRRAAAALAGVNHLRAEHPFDLPFVLRKRLTFSAVAHLQKPWFIFDEPTVGQDATACDEMVAVLHRLSSGGAGVIVISHSQEFIRRLSARRLRLEDGRLREIAASTR